MRIHICRGEKSNPRIVSQRPKKSEQKEVLINEALAIERKKKNTKSRDEAMPRPHKNIHPQKHPPSKEYRKTFLQNTTSELPKEFPKNESLYLEESGADDRYFLGTDYFLQS